MSDMSIQAAWNEPVQAGQHFKNVVAPWCKSMWAAGHRLHVEVRLHEDAKTDRQRAYYHGVVLKTIAQQARPNGQAFDLRTWKEHFRAEFLGHKTVTTVNPITGKKSRRRQRLSTEDLGIRAYSKLIDRVQAFAVTELKVTFPATYDQWEAAISWGAVDPDTGEILG